MAYRIITHDRKAHLDEVLASAFISIHLGEPPECIIRMPSQEAAAKVAAGDFTEEDWFIDCGMIFDPEKQLFDHHQDNKLGSAALLVFETFFPGMNDSEVAEYIRLVSRVDTGGLRVLDDYEIVNETQKYWSFSQKMLMKTFEEHPESITALFKAGLEDKIRFEKAKRKAERWLETAHHTEICRVEGVNILVYHARPPVELASAIRAVDGQLVDENEIHAILSYDEKVDENRVLFRTNWGHALLNFALSRPQTPVFCHQGGFLMKFIPATPQEWRHLIRESRTEEDQT